MKPQGKTGLKPTFRVRINHCFTHLFGQFLTVFTLFRHPRYPLVLRRVEHIPDIPDDCCASVCFCPFLRVVEV